MGSLLDTSSDTVRSAPDQIGEILVGHEKTTEPTVPRGSRVVSGSRAGSQPDWTAILAAKGLEAPGYRETLEAIRKHRGES